MRELDVSLVTKAIRRLCIESNRVLPTDLENRIRSSAESEKSPAGRAVLRTLGKNLDAARETGLPICQDTGMAVVFADVGQEVHFTGGSLEDAVNEGVRRGYRDGFLRCSVVADPFRRKNTGDNTPAVLHLRLVPGSRVSLLVAPKGFGSENMSRIRMFNPSATTEEVAGFVVQTVKEAGAPARPSFWASESGGILNSAPCSRSGPSAVRFPDRIPTLSTRRWSGRSSKK